MVVCAADYQLIVGQLYNWALIKYFIAVSSTTRDKMYCGSVIKGLWEVMLEERPLQGKYYRQGSSGPQFSEMKRNMP